LLKLKFGGVMASESRRLQPPVLVFTICFWVGIIGGLVARVCGLRLLPFDLIFVGFAIGIVCHELGHLFFAAIGSIPIRLIVIGLGPLLLRRRFGKTLLELRAWPLSGAVTPYPVVNHRWFRSALFIFGGVLGNVAVICLLAGLDAVGAAPRAAGDVLGPIVFAQVFIVVVNLAPVSVKVGGARVPTDGLRLLRLLWQPRDEAAQLRALHAAVLSKYSNGKLELPMSSASSRVLSHHLSLYDLAIDADARREALMRELEGRDLMREERMYVLDSLVTDGLISGEPTVRPRLDEWSLEALTLGPEVRTLRGSRGAVLVELGRHEEGKALLAPLAASKDTQPFDSLMTYAFLARAERALGDEAAARRFADAARVTAQGNLASPRVMAMLARFETEVPLAK
jgi:Peptidase family M50